MLRYIKRVKYVPYGGSNQSGSDDCDIGKHREPAAAFQGIIESRNSLQRGSPPFLSQWPIVHTCTGVKTSVW